MREIAHGTILSLVVISMLLTHNFAVEAQESKKIPRIGVLVAGHPPTRPSLEGFRQGLRDLGYVEHKNIVLEIRWDEGKPDPWSELAADLVRLKVDVILAGHTVAALGAKQATTTIPIVIGAAGGDPVAAGLVASLARPGGTLRDSHLSVLNSAPNAWSCSKRVSLDSPAPQLFGTRLRLGTMKSNGKI